jgi:hypothetical protein
MIGHGGGVAGRPEREEAARAEAARQEWYNSPERSWNSSERFYTHPDSNAFITWD